MSDSELAAVQDRISEQNRAGGRARTPAEARIPQGTDGRNAHGVAAATSSSGILPVTTRALPPDQTETPSHNPADRNPDQTPVASSPSVVWPPPMPATAARPYAAHLRPRLRPLDRERIMKIRKEIEQNPIPQGSSVEHELRRRVEVEQNRELLEAQQARADQAGMASLEPASGASTPAHWMPVGPQVPDHGSASDSPPSPASESDVEGTSGRPVAVEPTTIDLSRETDTESDATTRHEPDSPFQPPRIPPQRPRAPSGRSRRHDYSEANLAALAPGRAAAGHARPYPGDDPGGTLSSIRPSDYGLDPPPEPVTRIRDRRRRDPINRTFAGKSNCTPSTCSGRRSTDTSTLSCCCCSQGCC